MQADLENAKRIIEKIQYITIATTSKDGSPWNSPVWCAYDDNYNFYWASWKENRHSQNIRNNSKVVLVIYDSTVPQGTGFGVYFEAEAHELTDEKEIQAAIDLMYKRKNKAPRKATEFLGDYPRRVYKAVPRKVWVNSEGDINGNYIDIRKEIDLLGK